MEIISETNKKNISFFGIIVSPVDTIKQFKNRTKLLTPLIIISILHGIYAGIYSYTMLGKNDNVNELAQASGTTEERIQFVGGMISGTYTMLTIVFSIIILSVFLKFLSIFLNKDITFKQLMSIITYSSIIPFLGLVLNFFLSKLLGYQDVISFTSLSSLVVSDLLSSILEIFDVFRIWHYVLIGMGLYYVAGWSKKQISILAIVLITLIITGIVSMEIIPIMN